MPLFLGSRRAPHPCMSFTASPFAVSRPAVRFGLRRVAPFVNPRPVHNCARLRSLFFGPSRVPGLRSAPPPPRINVGNRCGCLARGGGVAPRCPAPRPRPLLPLPPVTRPVRPAVIRRPVSAADVKQQRRPLARPPRRITGRPRPRPQRLYASALNASGGTIQASYGLPDLTPPGAPSGRITGRPRRGPQDP